MGRHSTFAATRVGKNFYPRLLVLSMRKNLEVAVDKK
jgi:hypothetical protein